LRIPVAAHGNAQSGGRDIAPGMIHEYHLSENRPWKYFWVVFSGEDAGNICKKYINTDKQLIFDFSRNELKIIDLVNSIMKNPGMLTAAQALGYFYMLLSCHEAPADAASNYHVNQAKKNMRTHIYRAITVTEVAQALGISDRYLYNLFIKHLHISPKQYLNGLKISYAQTLIQSTDNAISEIAISVGFHDVLTFSRFFKNHTGMSPTEYRKTHRKTLSSHA